MYPQDKPECCKLEYPMAECFAVDICNEYSKLTRRHKQMQPKRRRIRYLALPKYITLKFRPSCACDSSRKTEIVREPPCWTRTEQLSYPTVRHLLPILKEYSPIFNEKQRLVLNNTIRKSVLSVYSRLANVQAPKEKKPVVKWTKKEWAIHRKYLKKLAKPKKIFYPPKPVRMWKDISLLKRYKKLCKPKKRKELVMPKWELTPAIKKYKASARILLLSKPKERDDFVHFQPLPIKVTENAMHYKASERIKELATAPEVRLGESDLKENPFGVEPNALKGKASERVLELARPKEHTDNHTRENPFMISPAALKAKASPRVLELAKPKGS